MRLIYRQESAWTSRHVRPTLALVTDSDTDQEEYRARLGVVLKEARRAAGFSRQEEAGERLGVVGDTIGRWERGDNGISAYDLMRLIRLYGFDADLAINPPASRVVIRRRLGGVAEAAGRDLRRAIEAGDEPA